MRRRIFWDSMLLIYLLEGDAANKDRVSSLLQRSYEREDHLMTSCLAIGEVMVGAYKEGPDTAAKLNQDIKQIGLEYLPFDKGAIDPFAQLRSQKIAIADAIQLACAASAGVDLFLTGDRRLWKAHVPGINFIADFQSPIL